MTIAPVRFEMDTDKLARALGQAPKRMRDELAVVLLKAGIAHENVIKRNRFAPYSGRNAGDRLQRRSGKLSQAYALTKPTPQSLEMLSGIRKGLPGSQYARMQETGGTIKAKGGGYLTIPLESALTPAGVLSGRYKIRKSGTGYTTDAGDTFIFRSRGGALLIGIKGRNGRDKKPKAFYVLKRQVKIPARFGFIASWKTLEQGLVPKLLEQSVRKAMGGTP